MYYLNQLDNKKCNSLDLNINFTYFIFYKSYYQVYNSIAL